MQIMEKSKAKKGTGTVGHAAAAKVVSSRASRLGARTRKVPSRFAHDAPGAVTSDPATAVSQPVFTPVLSTVSTSVMPSVTQDMHTTRVVSEVLKQLQDGGFLIKPLTTSFMQSTSAIVGPAAAADGADQSVLVGGEPALRNTLATLLGESGSNASLQNFDTTHEDGLLFLGSKVSLKTKEKIWAGQFLEFGELLGEQQSADMTLTISQSGNVSMSAQGKMKPITSFTQWQLAFTTFVAIHSERFPSETPALMKYLDTVRELALRYPSGLAWRYYDENFRQARQVNHVSWAKLHMEIYVKATTLFGAHSPQTSATHNSQNSRRIGTRFLNKPGFCWSFNKGQPCAASPCLHKHACQQCHGAHPSIQCTKKDGPKIISSQKQSGQARRSGPPARGVQP
jgi:hypothetical protein